MKPVTRILLAIGVVCLVFALAVPAGARLKPGLEHKETRVRPMRRPGATAPVSFTCTCPRAGGAVGPEITCVSPDRSCDDAATTNVELCDADSLCAADYTWGKCRDGRKINLSYPVPVVVANTSCDDAATSEIEFCLTEELCGGAECECSDTATGELFRLFDCTGWPEASAPALNVVRPFPSTWIRFLSSGRARIHLASRPDMPMYFDPNCERCRCPGGGLVDCEPYPPNRDCDDSATLGVAELCPTDPQCQVPVMCHCPTLGRDLECTGKRFNDACDNPATAVIELCTDEGSVCCGCLCPGATMPQMCLDSFGATPCLIDLSATDPRCATTP